MINPFRFRPETPEIANEPEAEELDGDTGDWEDNWLSNFMAWGQPGFFAVLVRHPGTLDIALHALSPHVLPLLPLFQRHINRAGLRVGYWTGSILSYLRMLMDCVCGLSTAERQRRSEPVYPFDRGSHCQQS